MDIIILKVNAIRGKNGCITPQVNTLFSEMTFEEQMRIIELKELDSDDERKVFTKLVCVYFEPKDDPLDTSCLSIDNSSKRQFPIENISSDSNLWSKTNSLLNTGGSGRSVSVSNLETRLHLDMQGTSLQSSPSYSQLSR